MFLRMLFKRNDSKRAQIGVVFMRTTIRILYILLFLMAFMLALEFIKISIASLSEELKQSIANSLGNPLSSLGIGWFMSFLTLNATSIATLSVNLTGHDIISYMDGFFLILGSRIGASAIILILGIIFFLKGQSYRRSINVGLLTFLSVLTISSIAALFGKMIKFFGFDIFIAKSIHTEGPGPITTYISESLTRTVATFSEQHFGAIITFLLGFIMLILVIELLDKVFYVIDFNEMDVEKSPMKNRIIQLLHSPVFAFILGIIFTALTFSLTVSMSILIPIYTHESLRNKAKEILSGKRIAAQMIIPYALGANIGSFIDIIFFAKISGSLIGLALVYNIIISSLLAIIFIILIYKIFSDILIKISDWALSKPGYLPEIIVLLAALPLLLTLVH